MRLHRFYVTQPLGEDVVIENVSLVNQWSKVFRYTSGDFVILFNGDGVDYTYVLNTITKQTCTLSCTKQRANSSVAIPVTLCLALIKKDNFELATQKATELGVSAIVPLLTDRSEKKNLSFERLARIAVEASEQCGRGTIPEVQPITTLTEYFANLTSEDIPLLCQAGEANLLDLQKENTKRYHLFIGPEGGWGEDELLFFKEHGVLAYSLGKNILRAETAAITSVFALTSSQ